MLHNLMVQVWCATLSINCYLNRELHQQFAGHPASPMTNIYTTTVRKIAGAGKHCSEHEMTIVGAKKQHTNNKQLHYTDETNQTQ